MLNNVNCNTGQCSSGVKIWYGTNGALYTSTSVLVFSKLCS